MNINLNITLTASPELLELLKALAGNSLGATPKPAKGAKEPKLSAVNTEEKPVEEKPAAETKDVVLDLAAVRAKATPLSKLSPDNKAKIKAKITEFGAESLDKLDSAKYADFMEFLKSFPQFETV